MVTGRVCMQSRRIPRRAHGKDACGAACQMYKEGADLIKITASGVVRASAVTAGGSFLMKS